MNKTIKIIDYTKNPLNHIGKIAGICWNSNTENEQKNIERAKSCINSGHGRILEYADITVVINGYSARCIRELYTHIQGVSRLQASTRYINYSDVEYYSPKFNYEHKSAVYIDVLDSSISNYKKLLDNDISKEDAANALPLGMSTKIVWKINLRALVHFMNVRLCSRAYSEIRDLANSIKILISALDDEWKWISENLFVPKCITIGYCQEEKCCGKMPKGLDGLKQKLLEEIKNEMSSV